MMMMKSLTFFPRNLHIQLPICLRKKRKKNLNFYIKIILYKVGLGFKDFMKRIS